ncbi:amidase [Mycena floridula]|nr:amidase [Mycena floridula]
MWPFTSYASAIVDAKLGERTRLLALNKSELGPEHTEYLLATGPQIVQHIQDGHWTASQVLEAYIAKAIAAHVTTNCITEVLFDQARQIAQQLDVEFATTKRLRGPLHGIPFSIKAIDYKGVDTTIGFTQWAHKPAQKNATLVAQLLQAGAIPIVKTNVPQTMFAFECNNPLWGRSLNPYNSGYTCGGSSGGEAALLASDGACFGIGSDIGGSLRLPAAFCGISSLKPGHGRLSMGGSRGVMPGYEGIRVVAGPMARSIDDLELVCKVTFGSQDPADFSVVPLPYRPFELSPKLHFGYYTTNGWVKPSPAVQRAVLETVDALRKAGHECTEFRPPSVVEAISIFVGLSSSDAYKTMLSHLGPDPMDHSIWLVTFGAKLPSLIRSLASWIIGKFFGDKMFAEVLRHARRKPFDEYLKYTNQRNKFNIKFYEEVWNKYGFDGIIAPTQALPQIPHGGCTQLSSLACETFYYNLVDSPVGCMPVTRVDSSKDQLTEEWTKDPAFGASITEAVMYKTKHPWYDAAAIHGMPVGIQVIGKRWEEEKVLEMMRLVQRSLGQTDFGPGALSKFQKSTLADRVE